MSCEVNFVRFLKKLSPRDRKLYILLESYRDSLAKFNISDEILQVEATQLLSEFFETEIFKLLESTAQPFHNSIYESHRNDKAERSVSVKKSEINKADKLETERNNISRLFLIQNSQCHTQCGLTASSRDFKLSVIRDIDKQFDEKLGEWASSFSDSDYNTEDEKPVDFTKRLANASDLSSDDEQNHSSSSKRT